MGPWFIATERFGPQNKEAWAKFIAWSTLNQLEEVVSLDSLLNPTVLKEMKDKYWSRVPDESRMFGLFNDLAFLRKEISGIENTNLLCVYLNPAEPPQPPQKPLQFELLGYDLVEVEGSSSALTNCGGFPDVFANNELSPKGLLTSLRRAQEVQAQLRALHPEEHHADCDVWAIARAVEL
jgi:hypothetical protein